MKKQRSIQAKLRKEKFSFDQYWSVQFTEVFANRSEKDYKTIIKARSADLAKEILQCKIKKDNPKHRAKAIQLFMLRPDGQINGYFLTTKDWSHIHRASFPNVANVLFKCYKPRPEGYTNRFNKKDATCCNRFKKGEKYRFYIPPDEEKPYWKWDGKWKPWPKKERENLKEQMILALSLNNNSRTLAAKAMGLGRRHFYKLMNKKFVEVNWDKKYPAPKPNIKDARIDHAKRIKNMKAAQQRKSEEYIKNIYPKYKELQKQGLLKSHIRRALGCNINVINKCIEYDKRR